MFRSDLAERVKHWPIVWPGDDTMRRSSDWAPEMNFRCAVSCRQRIYCRHRLSAHSHYGCNTLAVYCAAICLILTRWCAKHPLSIKLHFVSAWLHDAITGCCGCCFVGLLVGCWARMTVAPFEVTMKLLGCTSLLWQPATVVSASGSRFCQRRRASLSAAMALVGRLIDVVQSPSVVCTPQHWPDWCSAVASTEQDQNKMPRYRYAWCCGSWKRLLTIIPLPGW